MRQRAENFELFPNTAQHKNAGLESKKTVKKYFQIQKVIRNTACCVF